MIIIVTMIMIMMIIIIIIIIIVCDFQQSFREYYTLKCSFLFFLKLVIVKKERCSIITQQFVSLRFEYDIIGLLKLTDDLIAFIHAVAIAMELFNS